MIFNSLRKFLAHPAIYNATQAVLGAPRLRRMAVTDFLRPREGERILDVGCGPGGLLKLLPQVRYIGFDTNAAYIAYAAKRWTTNAKFHCERLSERHVDELGRFNAVVLLGVLHHLNDYEANGVLGLIARLIEPAGRVVTLDPCFIPEQSKFERWTAEHDRGRFVRTPDAYDALFGNWFGSVRTEIRRNVCRIPSTERFAVLTQPRRVGGA